MQLANLFSCFCAVITVFATTCMASEEKFDSEEMLSEIEKQLHLSQEKLDKLKPAIDRKSAELKETIHEAVDQGFVQLDEATKNLDKISKDAEKKVQDFLTGEEMQQLKDYLNKVDEDAIREAKEQLVDKMTKLLELSEEQIASLKPIFEDGVQQLGEMLNDLAKEGSASLEKFKQEYETLSKEMHQRLEEQLNSDQLKKLEDYNMERKDKIQQNLFIEQ